MIVCDGTALALLDIKPSTKHIDLMVPNEAEPSEEREEYRYLIDTLKQLGYNSASGWGWHRGDGFIFDLFRGKSVHTTELLESPLEGGNHILIKEFSHVYLGVLNYYDIIISKLFRAAGVDIDDCVSLLRRKRGEIDLKKLKIRFRETAAYDVSETSVNKNLGHFLNVLEKEGLIDAG